MDDVTVQTDRQEALAYIRHAIALCDRLGESLAACHLQWGADILDAAASGHAVRAAAANRSKH